MNSISSPSSSLFSQIAQQAFKASDKDKNGALSKAEFADVFAKGPSGAIGEKPEDLFRQFDTDANGQLSQEEASKGLQSILARLQNQLEGLGGDGSSSRSKSSQLDLLEAFRQSDEKAQKAI